MKLAISKFKLTVLERNGKLRNITVIFAIKMNSNSLKSFEGESFKFATSFVYTCKTIKYLKKIIGHIYDNLVPWTSCTIIILES